MEGMEYTPSNLEEEMMSGPKKILCCTCSLPIEPNLANMCVACLRINLDITEHIPKQVTIHYCRNCERYLNPPNDWIHCSLESRELLQLCLKKLKGMEKVKLTDANFVWTEAHSKRIKIKVTVEAEVFGGIILKQVFIVEYTIANQMCDDCHRTEAKDFWKALVQIRQKSNNKKTFYYLEQLIVKYKAAAKALGLKSVEQGVDFFFTTESQARKMVDFITTVIPCRYQHSKKLLSHDVHSNTYNYKFTFSVEIVPISKNSIVCLSKKMSHQFGGISQLCIVLRVTNNIHIIDPYTAQLAEISGQNYWRDPFNSMLNPKQMIQYFVMEIEPVSFKERKSFPGQGPISNKHLVADVWLTKVSDLGVNDNMIHTRTHLGHILKPCDIVLGYNISDTNVNDDNFDKLNKEFVPEVIILKKFYEFRKKRNWKLRHIPRDDTSIGSANQDYNDFLDDLEEDPLYRKNINIYHNKQVKSNTNDIEDPNQPMITLDEMLDDLAIEE